MSVILCMLTSCKQTSSKPKKGRALKLTIGQKAPNFTLPDENNRSRSLSDYAGKKIVLYFYPKDYTPGCTKEACALRDAYKDYQERNIIILGVSYDSPQSHKKFKAKHKLPFTLLSDTSKSAAKKYGAYSGMFAYFAPARKTFLIDENGIIIKIFNNVDVATHAQEILTAFDQQNS